MSTRKPKHIAVAEATANTLFTDMQNPDYQGEQFTWDKLPGLVKSRVETSLFMYYTTMPADYDALKALAGKHAEMYTQNLIDNNPEVRALTPAAKKRSHSP